MMKKTLLSMMTMAALLSTTSASAAEPVNKEITVEAKIVDTLTLTKSNGMKLDSIKLGYDLSKNDGTYTNATDIKIVATNRDPKVNIKLSEEFKLTDKNDAAKVFTDHKVTLNGQEITTVGHSFDLQTQKLESQLIINAKQPVGAIGTYSGTLKLVLESET